MDDNDIMETQRQLEGLQLDEEQAEEGQRLLAQSGLPVNLASSLEEAAKKVVSA